METLNFRVCVSSTLDDNTAIAWSVYPVANACLAVPWWYAAVFYVVTFLSLRSNKDLLLGRFVV